MALMYPYSYLPKPLSALDFYILLVISRDSRHAYAIRGAVANASLGSLRPSDGSMSKSLQRLHDVGFIDIEGMAPAGKSGVARRHYILSSSGAVRLNEELDRLEHAVKIAEAAGMRR